MGRTSGGVEGDEAGETPHPKPSACYSQSPSGRALTWAGKLLMPSVATKRGEPTRYPAHDGDAPAASGGAHQHDPRLAGTRIARDDQHYA